MTRLTPWTARILHELADSEWHQREQIIAAVAPLVPPGVAYRTAEADRARKTSLATRTVGDDQTAVAAGARYTIRRTLNDLHRGGRIEIADSRIRLTDRGAQLQAATQAGASEGARP